MRVREKTDFCDACLEPWYPRLLDADGEPMENICDECSELIEDGDPGLYEDDERPPICPCGVTMSAQDDEDGETIFVCLNENCAYYGEPQ